MESPNSDVFGILALGGGFFVLLALTERGRKLLSRMSHRRRGVPPLCHSMER